MGPTFFDYDLPTHLIAQEPCADRDQARLMVIDRGHGSIEHYRFLDLPKLLTPGDLLVLNDTHVVPARLEGRRERTGGRWEGLYLRELPDGSWELLCQTRGRLLEGETILVEPGALRLVLAGRTPRGHWLARVQGTDPNQAPVRTLELLQRHGRVPLPPYIRKGRALEADKERYQTMYARRPGAVAAPTAGLHFTERVFEGLQSRGISRAFVTLHVGLGTFQPIQTSALADHKMHREWMNVSQDAAQDINACRARGGRIIAVGTTSARVLETVASDGPLREWSGETELFIHPPYTFRAVDGLITNFHLPRTTLLLLVGAFAGEDLLRRAYEIAIRMEYRFFSYGDAMLIV